MRLGVGERGKLSEGFPDPRKDIQANARFPQKTATKIHRGRERHRTGDKWIPRQKKVGVQANSERWPGPRSWNAGAAEKLREGGDG